MARIFQWAAISHAGLLAAALVLGVRARSARLEAMAAAPAASMSHVAAGAPAAPAATLDLQHSAGANMSLHVALAVFTLLAACLIQTVVFTYFTVTGKLIQQALALGKFDVPAGMAPVKRRKAWITRMVALSILPIVLAAGTGAWGIAGVPQQRWHLAAGLLVTLVHVLAYPAYHRRIVENGRHLDDAMRAYQEQKAAAARAAATPGT
ncbi:MAG: hypothetical protein C4547_05780 [Phycisphaerales bacterium]|nr:MAG: hypothetical protein C4547_05780 [Phycisphaerales bacterium]